MTVSGYNGPVCREIRQLLGVYVVGAIDPAERPLVDDHLGECADCRDELAGLAGLPAMLSRVPLAEVERIASGVLELPGQAEPSAELLNSLLRRVAAKRRSRMWRGAVAVAAAAVIAAGGATAVSQLTGSNGSSPGQSGHDVASAMNPVDHIAAVVDYAQAPWNGTAMRVQVSGITPGTTCKFWVVSAHGRAEAGSWTVGNDYDSDRWYSASAQVKTGSIRSFTITSGTRVLLTIPGPDKAG
jgi:hypothetical protein